MTRSAAHIITVLLLGSLSHLCHGQSPAQPPEWTEPEVVSSPSHDRKAYLPSICPRPGGGIYAAWAERFLVGDSQYVDVMFREFDGHRWLAPVNVSHDLAGVKSLIVVSDGRGVVYLAWLLKPPPAGPVVGPSVSPELVCSARTAQGWTRPKRIEFWPFGPGMGYVLRAFHDDNGQTNLVWVDPSRPHTVGARLSVSATTGLVASGPAAITKGLMSDVARDVAGNLHLATVHSVPQTWEEKQKTGDVVGNDVFYSFRPAGFKRWEELTLVYQSVGTAADWPRIAVSPSGLIHIVWLEDYDNDLLPDALRHSYSHDGAHWSEPLTIARFNEGMCLYQSIVCDHLGTLHVVWTHLASLQKPASIIYYAMWDSVFGWRPPEPLFPNSHSPQLCLDEEGKLHLVWTGASSPDRKDKKIFHCEATLPARPSIVTTFRLEPAAPNPFRETTTLTYRMAAPAFVRIQLWDVRGRLVRTLHEGWAGSGIHTLRMDAKDLPAGVYLCTMQTSGLSFVRKIVKLQR